MCSVYTPKLVAFRGAVSDLVTMIHEGQDNDGGECELTENVQDQHHRPNDRTERPQPFNSEEQ